jgi:beta-glucosidase
MRRAGVLLLAVFLLPAAGAAQAGAELPYRNAGLPVSERVHDLIGRMTLEEKFWQLFMLPGDLDNSDEDWSKGVFGLQISSKGDARSHTERINTIQRFFVEQTRLGIPIIPFDEAVHGLVREGATVFPAAISLAASWDTGLVGRVARAIAAETRSRGIRQVLSPVLNLANDVRWGRVEETYGEDPWLVSQMGRAFVGAFEANGVIATPKHFVANVGEGGRDSYPIGYDERTLQEFFFPPFQAVIQGARARSVMSAYNSVAGVPATQSHWLLDEVLKRAWGFSGFVISDAAATGGATVLHHTEANTASAARDALNAGLDVIFQSSFPQHRPYLDAFRRGLIADSVIDSAVARVLRAKLELGLFEHPYADADSAARLNHSPEHRALALESARAGIVLLTNEHGTLPLKSTVRSIAVIGADASEARLGGYSGPGAARLSILEALRRRMGATRVRYAPGPGRLAPEWATIPAEQLGSGLRGEYFANPRLEGQPQLVRTDPRLDFGWTLNAPAPDIPFDWYSVRWTGNLLVPRSGVHRIGLVGNDGFRLWLDGKLLIDNWVKRSFRPLLAAVVLPPGSRHALKVEYFETTGNARLKLVWDAGVSRSWPASIDSAMRMARASDVAVVVAGIEEGEFRDRALLSLPGHQEDLILRVAATGKPVVVALVGGSAVTMTRWLDRVGAVLDVWYPGEQGGAAVADILFGDSDPAGRLPISFPLAEGQLPLVYDHLPTGRGDDYVDLTGRPLFPFGFGLSYTSFAYSALAIEPAEISPDGRAIVHCRIKNVGPRAGDEVAQLYLRDVLASVARPIIQLAGFQRVHLEPGEERELSFGLGPEQLRLWSAAGHWVVEPGRFRVMIGASSMDIRLRGELTVR